MSTLGLYKGHPTTIIRSTVLSCHFNIYTQTGRQWYFVCGLITRCDSRQCWSDWQIREADAKNYLHPRKNCCICVSLISYLVVVNPSLWHFSNLIRYTLPYVMCYVPPTQCMFFLLPSRRCTFVVLYIRAVVCTDVWLSLTVHWAHATLR